MQLRVGIVGISSIGGGEALGLTAGHRAFRPVCRAGEGRAGGRLGARLPGAPAGLADPVIDS